MYKKAAFVSVLCLSLLFSATPLAGAAERTAVSRSSDDTSSILPPPDLPPAPDPTDPVPSPTLNPPSNNNTQNSPAATMKRSDVALSLWVREREPAANQTCGFSDVPANATYGKAACWMKQEGIADGVLANSSTFGPDVLVTRGQAALFIWRAAGTLTSPEVCTYRDVAPTSLFAEAICWVKQKNIITGTAASPTYFSPDETISSQTWTQALLARDQVVVPPVAVAAPQVVAGVSRCSLTWTTPRSDAPVVEYQVVRTSGNLLSLIYRQQAGLSTVDNTTGGVLSYQYQVRARNVAGWSYYSPLSSVCSPTSTPPSTPASLVAAAGNRSVSATWSSAPGAAEYIATLYRQSDNQPVGSCTSSTLTCVIGDAIPSNQTAPLPSFYVRVVARNAAGDSQPSGNSNIVTPYRNPDAPTNVVATAGNREATISWTAPFNGGQSITEYVATASPGGATCRTATTSCKITGLLNGTLYTVSLKAVSSAGESPASTATVTPQGPPPEQFAMKIDTNLIEGTTVSVYIGYPASTTIDWGDGTSTSINQPSQLPDYGANYSKTYSTNGVYTIKLNGTVRQIGAYGSETPFSSALTEVTNFGEIGLEEVGFLGAANLVKVPTSLPPSVKSVRDMFMDARKFNQNIESWDVSNVTDMNAMFNGATEFNQPLNNWDVSNVTDMSGMFAGSLDEEYNLYINKFNQPLDKWNTSKVYSMASMFRDSLFNQNINSWDTSNVILMPWMFENTPFNKPLNNWNTSQVQYLNSMFGNASQFSQDISSWDVSSAIYMDYMFSGAVKFNSDIGSWNTSQVTKMNNMFSNALVFNKNIGSWNTSKVTDMSYMFSRATSFNQPLNSWDVSKVTNMDWMFRGATSFNQPIGSWNVTSLQTTELMFAEATAFNQSLTSWNVSNLTNSRGMFLKASKFNQPLNSWNVSNLTNMSLMFADAIVFNQPLNSWNTSKVTDMGGVFDGAANFNQPLGSWDVSKATSLERTFQGASSFNQNIGSWNTTNVTTMQSMFGGATAFNNGGSSTINSWKTGNVKDMARMFLNALAFNQPIGSWDVSNVLSMQEMFLNAEAFNQPIGSWNVSKVQIMASMFFSAGVFNQNVGSWNVSKVTAAWSMFYGAQNFNNGGSSSIANWNTSAMVDVDSMFSNAYSFSQDISGWNVTKAVYWRNFNTAASLLTSAKIPPKFRNVSPAPPPRSGGLVPVTSVSQEASAFTTQDQGNDADAQFVSYALQGAGNVNAVAKGSIWELTATLSGLQDDERVVVTVNDDDTKSSLATMNSGLDGLTQISQKGQMADLNYGVNVICAVVKKEGAGSRVAGCARLLRTETPELVGTLENVKVYGPNGFTVKGWGLNLASGSDPAMQFYVDGRFVGTANADQTRIDVAKVYPGYDDTPGFSATIFTPLRSGEHEVCAYATINEGVEKTLLGCQKFYRRGGAPDGALTAALVKENTVTLQGWALDYDTVYSSDVHVYVDGAFSGRIQANRLRRDIGYYNPGYGDFHGFEYNVARTGAPQEICVYAINVGEGEGNPLLGCTTAT